MTSLAADLRQPPALRPYQKSAVEDLRDAYRRGARAPLPVLPTDAGKTVVFSHIAAAATAKDRSVLVLVHRRELIRQASEKLTVTGVTHGVIAPGYESTDELVQVASMQTLARRLSQIRNAPQLIIIDEAHHGVAGQWRAILETSPQAWLLGVTATPIRLDGAGPGVCAGGIFDAMVDGPGIADLTASGHLVPARIFAPAVAPNLSGIRTRSEDYAPEGLTDPLSTPEIVQSVIDHHRRHAAGQPTLLFADSLRHAAALAAGLRGDAIASTAVSGSSQPPNARTPSAGS